MLTYVQNTISLSTLQYLNLVIVLRNYSHRNLPQVVSSFFYFDQILHQQQFFSSQFASLYMLYRAIQRFESEVFLERLLVTVSHSQ